MFSLHRWGWGGQPSVSKEHLNVHMFSSAGYKIIIWSAQRQCEDSMQKQGCHAVQLLQNTGREQEINTQRIPRMKKEKKFQKHLKYLNRLILPRGRKKIPNWKLHDVTNQPHDVTSQLHDVTSQYKL